MQMTKINEALRRTTYEEMTWKSTKCNELETSIHARIVEEEDLRKEKSSFEQRKDKLLFEKRVDKGVRERTSLHSR